jgi:alkanesulfonate monooxygenase SsuD/methylene tetrahydromethanopterin reductase-like flavin-dependent oxidoreductase (luciferase family)
MPERLGLGIIGVVPSIGWRASEIRAIAHEAEDAGFDAIVTTEANSDSLATAQLMGEATQQIKVGGELADGVMPFMWSAARVTQAKMWAARGRAKAPVRGPLDVALGIPTFVGDDIEAQRNAARANLALFTTLPFYQRMFRASGFAEEAAKAEQGTGGDALNDRMLDAICLIGPISRCQEQLAAFRAAGVDLPILSPPIGIEGAREVIKAFRH